MASGQEIEAPARGAVLIVDDDPDLRGIVRRLLGDDYEVHEAADAEAGVRFLEMGAPDVVLLDLRLGGGPDGFSVLDRCRALDPELPVVVLSVHHEPEIVVRAMRAGAAHYIGKPPRHDELRERVRLAIAERRRAQVAASQLPQGPPHLIGTSAAIERVREQVLAAARCDMPVLIFGETGTGKGLAARCIHEASERRGAPFCDVNVGGLPSSVLDSELFGHERGAFTGAVQRHRGLFELAARGTLLLDEIGDLPHDCQVKLLKVVEDRCFRRVGGEVTIPARARIISATHRDLEAMIDEGTFREDLYHRLLGLMIEIPPLRQRPEDVGALVRWFLGGHVEVGEEALDWLRSRPWRGNVRELQQTLRRASLFAPSERILREHLEEADTNGRRRRTGGHPPAELFELPYEEASRRALESFRETYVKRAMERARGNVSRASRATGLSRSYLHVLLRDRGTPRYPSR